MTVKYLHDRKHYEDRYDRATVEQARWYEDHAEKAEDAPREMHRMLSRVMIYFLTGDRWKNRESTITEWMEKDRAYDDMYENAPIPKDIFCFMCDRPMEFMDKSAHYGFGKERHAMDFYFRCDDCHVGIKIKDGLKERIIPWMCPKCKRRMKSETKHTKDKYTTKDWCEYCGHSDTHEIDLKHPKPEKVKVDPEEVRKFREDKLRFCLTDEEGHKYLEGVRNVEAANKAIEESKSKEEKRKEQLKDNPKGFPLTDGRYFCGMCGHDVPSFDNWYDKYGIKCMACQHALERKTVPLKYFKDTDSWYSLSDLKSKFGIHSQTALKHIRQGNLKAYVIPGENGSPTCYVFPKKEAQAFLGSESNP